MPLSHVPATEKPGQCNYLKQSADNQYTQCKVYK